MVPVVHAFTRDAAISTAAAPRKIGMEGVDATGKGQRLRVSRDGEGGSLRGMFPARPCFFSLASVISLLSVKRRRRKCQGLNKDLNYCMFESLDVLVSVIRMISYSTVALPNRYTCPMCSDHVVSK